MEHTWQNEDDGKDGFKNDIFFIEGCSSSQDEEEIKFGFRKRHKNGEEASNLSRESSPVLLLAFPTSGKDLQDTISTTSDDLQEELEGDGDGDQPIEEWMILGGEEQVEDSSIQLNLSYWNSSEDDFGYEDKRNDDVKSATEAWAVSDKDKYGAGQSLANRYFLSGRSPICHICNRMGHVAKSCHLHRKCPTCVLCGMQGHTQRDCPGRPCTNCGLSSHNPNPCKVPPVWNQYCQRCGMTGHLSDACPDTWRQYHLTIRLEVPRRPSTTCTVKHKTLRAHCYNCSKRGHYGYECKRMRMVSGTFPSLPYVCHYDTIDDILQCCSSIQTENLASVQSLPPSDQEHFCEKRWERSEENPSVQRSSKQETSSRAGRRKTWPERRRERRQARRRRREAQAMREGGLLQRSCWNSDDQVCAADPLRQSRLSHSQFIPPTEKIRDGKAGGKSRKSREAERWKKRGGMKRGDLYPHGNVDIGSENLFSPKQRVRHRRR